MTSKPLIIPVFIPQQGCPHQCVFCNQSVITARGPAADGNHLPAKAEIDAVVDRYLGYRGSRDRVELAFFGGNFLGLSREAVHSLLSAVQPRADSGDIDGIRFSTRPDTVTGRTLEWLRPFRVCTVELGVQSMDDAVLAAARRGHTAGQTVRAVSLLRKNGFRIGAQIMAGLPGDTDDTILDSARKVAALCPDFIRIYPLLVLKESPLASWYTQGRYRPLSLDHAVALVARMVGLFQAHDIPVVRTGLQASGCLDDPDQVLGGPWHPAFGHLVYSRVMLDQAIGAVEAALDRTVETTGPPTMVLRVHPRWESRLRGNRNQNLQRLESAFPRISFRIQADPGLRPERVAATLEA